MIAIFIGMIIIGATYAAYISQQRSFTSQDQVAEMNSTSKIALDIIANDIRETGFGVPTDLSGITRAGCSGINSFTQKINFTDNANSDDQITLLGGFRFVGNTASAVTSGSTTLQLTTTSNLGMLNTADRSYISISGLSFAIVGGINTSTNTLTLYNTTPVDKAYPAGVPVYLVEDVTYQVVFNAANNRNELRKVSRINCSACGGGTNCSDTDVIAENIEDLQFATVDINGDGITDRIRVNILSITPRPDPNFRGQGNPPAQIENRNHAPTNDGFRRRWWQMEVDLRNQI
jgi:Tfp pilus assembly protein PilW